MKKLFSFTTLLIITNVLTISALVFGCCCHRSTACRGNCYPQKCDTLPLLNKDLAIELVRNYRKNHWTTVNTYCASVKCARKDSGDSCLVDSRAVWFSLDTLKMLINEIETDVCKNECGKPLLGIRIYYGEYPDSNCLKKNFGIMSGNYAGLHTLIMIPTCDINGVHTDFDPRIPLGESCEQTSTMDKADQHHILGLTPTITSSTDAKDQSPGMTKNHGESIPPPFPVSQWKSNGAAFMIEADADVPDGDPIARYDENGNPVNCCK